MTEKKRYEEMDIDQEEITFQPMGHKFQQTEDNEIPDGYREYHNPVHTEEEEIAPGLYASDMDSWKKQFGEVWIADIKGDIFVYRSIQRYEYKEIVALPNTDALMREEVICEYCVLYPDSYSFSVMAGQKAGVPSLLSQAILENSAFTREMTTQKW